MKRSFMLSAVLLGTALATSCQAPPRSRQSSAEAEKAAACRAETDRVYRNRDRAALYRPEQRDSPFSGDYNPGDPARGLGELYGRDQTQAECLRDVGAGNASPAASTGPAFNTESYRP